MRVIICLILALGILFPASFNTSSVSAAKKTSVVKHDISITPKMENDISYIKKHTNFTNEEIKDFYVQGFTKENMKDLYILKNMSHEKFEVILDIYRDQTEIEMVLKDLSIDPDEFQKEYEKQFPKDIETDHDRIKSTTAPWTRLGKPDKN
jgi:hypothetical protein